MRKDTAFTGSVGGGKSLDDAHFVVLVAPKAEIMRSLEVGDKYTELRLPADQVVRTQGNEFTLDIAPALIPSRYISNDGLMSVSVLAILPDHSRAFTTGTVRLNEAGGVTSPAWGDAGVPASELAGRNGQRVGPAKLQRMTISPATSSPPLDAACVDPEPEPSPSMPPDDETVPDDPSAPAAAVGSNSDTSGLTAPAAVETTATVVASSVRRATIGTTYPVSNDPAWVDFTSSATKTYGAAYSASGSYGTWSASGSRTLTNGFTASYTQNDLQRSYRVDVRYNKNSHYACGTYYTWDPANVTGGGGTNDGISRPDWTHCAPIDNFNTWSRQRDDGYDYTLSNGVNIDGLIGIDLSTRSAYSSSTKTTYRMDGAARRMCGNNADPAIAAKVMEKYQ